MPSAHLVPCPSASELVGDEWAELYSLSPAERWNETERIWHHFLQMGGSPDPEPNPSSPFFNKQEWRALSSDKRSGLRIIRRGGV